MNVQYLIQPCNTIMRILASHDHMFLYCEHRTTVFPEFANRYHYISAELDEKLEMCTLIKRQEAYLRLKFLSVEKPETLFF